NSDNSLVRFVGTNPTTLLNLGQPILDLRSRNENLILSTASRVIVMNEAFSQILSIQSTAIPELDSTFTCATIIESSIYIGTLDNGVVETSLDNSSSFEFLLPQGPARNNIFSITATPSGTLWPTY